MTLAETATSKGNVSALRKAAILLISLGEDVSADLMQQLPLPDVKRLSEEIARMRDISEDHTETVLREFYQMNAERRPSSRGGPEFTQKLLNRALGQEGARRLLSEVPNSPTSGFAKLAPVVRSDPARVARTLNEEHPQTIALILSHLPAEQAVDLLRAFTPEQRKDVGLRMARLEQVSPEVIARIAEAVGEKFKAVETVKRETFGGVRLVADLCNRLDPEFSEEILSNMESNSPDLAESVRKVMFVFEDILTLDDMAMSEVNTRADRKVLIMALKGTSDQIKEHFTKRMSSRARDMLLEDLDALGPVKIKEVEEAQQEIIATVRQLQQEGVISTRSGGAAGGGDEYVS